MRKKGFPNLSLIPVVSWNQISAILGILTDSFSTENASVMNWEAKARFLLGSR